MEQSANPAARVRHYIGTISTSTQNASIWSLTAAAPSDSVFRALCINWLTYLLTYLRSSRQVFKALYDVLCNVEICPLTVTQMKKLEGALSKFKRRIMRLSWKN